MSAAQSPPPVPEKRSRWRRWWLGVLLLPVLLVAALAYGLLATEAGLRQALQWAESLSDGMVQVSAPAGTLGSEFTLATLRVRAPGVDIDADGLRLAWSPVALLHGELRIDALDVARLRVATAPSDDSAPTPPTRPDSLALPVAVTLARLQLGALHLDPYPLDPATPPAPAVLAPLHARLSADGARIALDLARLDTPWGSAQGALGVAARAPFETQGTLALRTRQGEHDVQAEFALSGPLDALAATVAARGADARVDLAAQLAPFAAQPLLHLRVNAEGIDPAQWLAGAPGAAFTLATDLVPDAADATALVGPLQLRNLRAGPADAGRIPLLGLRGDARIDPTRLRLDALAIELAGGGRIEGALDAAFDGSAQADVRLAGVNARALDGRLPATRLAGQIKALADASGQRVSGALADADAAGNLRAELDLRHVDGQVAIDALSLRVGKGRIAGKGRLSLADAQPFEATLAVEAFAPRAVWRDAPEAQVNARVALSGQLAPLQAGGTYELGKSTLAGRPLAGSGAFKWQGERLADIDAWLAIGDNRLDAKGAWGGAADQLTARLRAPRLDHLDASLGGAADLDAQISGGLRAPAGRVNGTLSALRLPGDIRLAGAQLDATLAAGADGPFELLLAGDALALGAAAEPTLERFAVEASGRRDAHILNVVVDAPHDALRARFSGGLSEALVWAGTIESLALSGRFPLSLQRPIAATFAKDRAQLAAGVLRTAEGGEVAFGDTRWQPGRLTTEGRFSGVLVGLETQPDARAKRRSGDLSLGGAWSLAFGEKAEGSVSVFRERGDLVLVGDTVLRFGIERFDALATVSNRQVALRVDAAGAQLGTLAGSGAVGLVRRDGVWALDARAPLLGSLSLDMPSIAWLGAVLSPAVRTDGQLKGEFSLGGTPAQPVGRGRVAGADLSIEITDEGLRLSGGTLKADFDADTLRIDELSFVSPSKSAPRERRIPYAALTATPGTLKASGRLRLSDGEGGLEFTADRLPLFQRPDRWLAISGSGRVQTRWDKPEINASMRADGGYLEFAKTPAPSLSDDVVVLGKAAPEPPARKLQARIEVDLGQQLYLSALGLDTQLAGQLTLVARSGQALRATGSLNTVGGTFEGYGQKLAIERGLVNFQGSLDNPGLNVVALRKGLEVEAGVSILGTVRRPQIKLVSSPEVPDAEKLSWIVLGRAPDGGNGADLALLLPAAQALLGGPGGGFTSQLAAGLGFDQFSLGQGELNSADRMSTSAVVGGGTAARGSTVSGQVLTVGKRLSTDTTLSFEQSLSGVEQMVKLTHQLSRRLSVIGRAGTDNAVDLRWSLSFR
ncbi:MAG: translocation/assembly module TamB domain-containing protein [Rhodocyclaceae bacterium]|nr:translocation/assembly module TamB domain-containing protein [Rhodocyclaceae bacterium]